MLAFRALAARRTDPCAKELRGRTELVWNEATPHRLLELFTRIRLTQAYTCTGADPPGKFWLRARSTGGA